MVAATVCWAALSSNERGAVGFKAVEIKHEHDLLLDLDDGSGAV
jgi:hypothetical protein